MKEKTTAAIKKLIAESRDAMVSSIDETGYPVTKAMFIAKAEGLHTFWFSTNVSAARTAQWQKEPKASIYLFNPAEIRAVLFIGTMKIHTAQSIKDAFWKEGDEQYYPLGVTDPDYCIAEFTAEKGKYYYFGEMESFMVGQ